jgi:hormone-sensitive lipase
MFHITPKTLNILKKNNNDEMFCVPMPLSHIGLKKIQCRLISKKFRRGMVSFIIYSLNIISSKKITLHLPYLQLDKQNIVNINEPSKVLIFYCHGGGFISQTTTTHEAYLKEIASKLDVPIISIDYSLVPFPRALEEIFYTYCWTLQNANFLGSTAEKIIIMGDSAGANLATCCVTKCIENGIRVPDNLVNFYGFFYVEFSMSPSRLLSVIDPFLPPIIISNILNSYLTGETSVSSSNDESRKMRAKNYLISPLLTPENILENFPQTFLYTSNFDASLDDNVEFAKKLKNSKVKVQLQVLNKIPHAFLNYIHVSLKMLKEFKSLMKF